MTTGVEHNMRKVLIVAYTFPPRGGSGVQRTAKFAKYLPEFGWQPVVLTVSNPPSGEADYSLLQELPGELLVYRTRDIQLPHLLRRNARKHGLISEAGLHPQQGGSRPSEKSQVSGKSRLRMALSRFADVWLQVPDQFVYWLPGALRVGLRIVNQCDVIFSTSDPFTDHLVACFLHKFSGKPWVADYRDPWTQYVAYQRYSSALRSRVDAFFEKRLLRIPNLVVVTCAVTAKSFLGLYPSLPEDKFVEITNGFDAEDFDQPDVSHFDTFTIAYTGRFSSIKNASFAFLCALRQIRLEYPDTASEIKVVFAGKFAEQGRLLLKEWSLEEMVEPLGYVSHHESVELLLKSHVLLLTLNDEPGVNLTYPGKLFEYLAARKIILALVPAGATADLVRGMGAGLVVSPDDVEAMKRTILSLYNQHKQGDTLSRAYDNLQRFERRALTERLAQCLDGVLEGDWPNSSSQA